MSNHFEDQMKLTDHLVRINDYTTDLNVCFKTNYYTVLTALNGLLASNDNLAVYEACETANALKSLLARIDLVDQLHEFKPAINLLLKRIEKLEEELEKAQTRYEQRMREIVQTETPRRQTYGDGMSAWERRTYIHKCAARGAYLFSDHEEIGSELE